jgi:hypothetical protein
VRRTERNGLVAIARDVYGVAIGAETRDDESLIGMFSNEHAHA